MTDATRRRSPSHFRDWAGIGLIPWASVVCLLCCSIGRAQGPKPGPHPAPGVDVVTLKSGRAVRGAIVQGGPTGPLTMAVSRSWLQQGQPEIYKKVAAEEAVSGKATAEQLRDRLKTLLVTPPAEPRLVFFLKEELNRVEMQLERKPSEESEQFVWLELSPETVSRVQRTTPDRQRVAMWAWSERLTHVETRETHDLERELKKLGIDSTAAPPELSDRLPSRMQDDKEWAARLALVEYGIVKPLDFQGTGDVLVRSDGERKASDLAPVLARVLRTQVDSLLKDLTGDVRPSEVVRPAEWIKSATREADALAIRGLRATRVEVKPGGNQATVETAFAARMPKGDWEIIWSHREVQDATRARPDLETRISEDPQIKQVLDAVKSFGLGVDEQVKQAIRFGAATMAAQQAADTQFYAFRDRYLQHLDRPPLLWSR